MAKYPHLPKPPKGGRAGVESQLMTREGKRPAFGVLVPKERDIRDTVRYRRLAGSEGFQTVKPEAAQKAFDLREKAKHFRQRADSDKTRFVLREKSSRETAARLDRESKEALNDLETPRKVTANVPKRATSPRSNTAREERNLRGDS